MNETRSDAPLTATVGERVRDDPHVQEVEQAVGRAPAGRRAAPRAARPFPWGTLALAAVAWALVSGVAGALGTRARRVARGVRRLAS